MSDVSVITPGPQGPPPYRPVVAWAPFDPDAPVTFYKAPYASVAEVDGSLYECLVTHQPGSDFATDLATGKWRLLISAQLTPEWQAIVDAAVEAANAANATALAAVAATADDAAAVAADRVATEAERLQAGIHSEAAAASAATAGTFAANAAASATLAGSYLTRTAMDAAVAGYTEGQRVEVTADGVNNGSWVKTGGVFVKRPDIPTLDSRVAPIEAVTGFFKRLAGEIGTTYRLRIGNRLLMTIDPKNGVWLRRALLPAGTKIDDDLTASLVSRLVPGGIGSFFGKLPLEAGGVMRLRMGNRLIATWSNAAGIRFARQTLPADCKVADQPAVNLVDRLGDNSSPYTEDAAYIATSVPDATTGKRQVRTIRKADGRQFNGLTSGASDNIVQFMTTTSVIAHAVVYWSKQDLKQYFVPAEGGARWPVFPDITLIDCWGDSLTNGTGGTPYPTQLLAALTSGGVANVTVVNRGIGGQKSNHIAARQGGAPALITVTGDQIPASGAVTVTAYSADLLFNSGVSGNLSLAGTLAGVAGTLSGNSQSGENTATYTFTRSTAGAIVACPPNTPFIPDIAVSTQLRVGIDMIGRNNYGNAAQVLADIAAMRAWRKPLYRFQLNGGVIAAVGDAGAAGQTTINALNDQIAALVDDDYVDVNSAPTPEEITTLGFVADTAVYDSGRTDAADIAGKACRAFSFTAGNPTAGETVSIAGSTITFVASGAAGPQLNIGANGAATAAALAAYVNANTGSLGVTAVAGTTINGRVLCVLVANVAGSGGNAIAIGKNSATVAIFGVAGNFGTLAGGNATPVLPSGMRYGATTANDDFLHLNTFGYALVALRMRRKLFAKGWFPSLAAA